MPFYGLDDLDQYNNFTFGKGFALGSSVTDRYETVAKYADNYIGTVISFIKNYYKETILLIVGDHGAREFPKLSDEKVDRFDESSAQYDDSCNFKSFSND